MGKSIREFGRTMFIMVVMIVITLAQFIPVSAETVNKALLAEQAKGKAPNVKVYMTGKEMTPEVSVSGNVVDISLSQDGDIKTFDETGEGLRYIILLDNSGSMNRVQFDESLKQIKKLRDGLKNNDEMQLYTVGTTDINSDKTDVFARTVMATETDSIQADKDMIDNIPYITGKESKTILYRSINQVIEEQSSQTSMDSLRTVILLVSDGEDDSDDVNGTDNDRDATLENVRNSSIPLYGILINNTSRNPNEDKIKFTKNKILNSDNSNGYYYNCSTKSDSNVVKKAFKKINKILREETYVVNLTTDSNKAVVGKNDLNLTVNNQAIDAVHIDYSDYEKDNDAPVIVGSVKKDGKNTITFVVEDSNGVNATDASDISHYSIQMDDGKEDSRVWTIEQVNAAENGNNVTITLVLNEEEFYNGDYTLTIDGIRDKSQDQNAMVKAKASFTVEDGLDGKSEARKAFIQKYWWIALIILIAVIGAVVIIIAKKKSVKIVEKEINPEDFNQADSKLIRLTITDRSGAIKDVEWNIEGSLFVGRSEICNIFFDDDRLSKQHFVIEVNKMGCYIEDLESTNGTFVNGVKMTNRRLLLDGDVITAGREKFIFHMQKNQIEINEEFDQEYI